jgi:bifunctional enzyme CysN/CysC
MADADLAAQDMDAYLAAQERKDLVRFLTAGSVDDGKSTLIGRLLYDTQMIYEDQLAAIRRESARKGAAAEIDLSLLMDGLKAEREQGITIDVAYRYFSTDKRKFIIADCPGHEQYTRNMATGASNCDLAIILIDARNGVVRQTKRHSFIVSLLGIRHVMVAVNKMDLVSYSQDAFDAIVQDYTAFATRLEISDLRFIPMSALKGDNVVEASWHMPWYRGETLLDYLETVHTASDRNLIDLRFPVQYVNRPNLNFRGFSGTVASGVLRKGDEVVALPSGQRSRVKTIVSYDGDLQEAYPPMSVTVTLTDEIDISRGDMLVHPANLPRVGQEFEAMVVWMDEEPLVPGKGYFLKHAAALVGGQVSHLRYRVDVNTLRRETTAVLAMNEVGRCAIAVNRRICFDPYGHNRATGSFIIIDRSTNRTVGAGMIVDRATSLKVLQDYWDAEPDSVKTTPAAAPPGPAQPVTRHAKAVAIEERAARAGHQPATVLLTGPSGSGKTTIAYGLERHLFDAGRQVCVLDGREMRRMLSRDLGYSEADRSENLRRAMDVARVANEAGLICICAFLAPSRTVRDKARTAIGSARFFEIYLSAPPEVRRARDPEGAAARDEGDAPEYEPPTAPDLRLATDQVSVDECVARIVAVLTSRGIFRS